MAFKFVIFALTLAYVNAGNLIAQPAAVHYSSAPSVSSSYFQQASAPVAYAKTLAAPAVAAYAAPHPVAYQSAPVAVHAPSVGLSQQSVARSLGGAQSVSTYSKAVDSAFSSVRKYDTRITNDGLAYAPAQLAYAAKAYAAPGHVVSYAAPASIVAKTYAAPAPVVSYAAPASIVSKTYAAPSPVVSYAAPAPIFSKAHAAPAPVVSYAAQKAYAAPAPVFSYGAPAPVVAKAVAPVAAYASAAPVISKAAVAYSPASVVAHTAFQGYGIEYHYFVIFALALAYVKIGNLIAQPAAVHYSSATTVSSSYFQQASAPVAYAKTLAAPAVAAYAAPHPVAYQSAPVAVHAPSVGLSQQSLARSLGGAQSVSTYSKAVDSAFSSIRKYDTRITNDGLAYAPAQLAYAAKAYAAPGHIVSYAAPASIVAKTYAAPAPVVSYAAPASIVSKTYAAPSPVVSYAAPAPIFSKSYAAPAPVVSYAAQKAYAAPAPVFSYGAPGPVVAKAVAPVAAYASAAPVVSKTAVAYSPASVVAHTAFQGYGVEYHY